MGKQHNRRIFAGFYKQFFCEMVEVAGEWVDKFTRQPKIRITDTHIQNLNDGGFEGPVRKKTPKDEDLAFLNDCVKTVLKSYSAYFRERYMVYRRKIRAQVCRSSQYEPWQCGSP